MKDISSVLKLIDYFEHGNLKPSEGEQIIAQVFTECGLPAQLSHGPGDHGVDVHFSTVIDGLEQTFAVEVKSRKHPISVAEVQQLAGASLAHDYDRYLLVTNNTFTQAARDFVRSNRLGVIDLLGPEELRKWVYKNTTIGSAQTKSVTVIIRTAMKQVAAFIAQNPEQLEEIEWRDLERVMREVFEGLGFETVLTRSGKDGGFDLQITTQSEAKSVTYLIELKHWKDPARPGSSVLKYFVDVIARESVSGGLLLSTSGFTSNVFEGITEIERKLVRLGDRDKIISMIQSYYKLGTEIWIKDATLPELLYEDTIA